MPLSTLTPGPTKHSDGNPAGQSYSNFGDPIGFNGVTPVAPPSGTAQAGIGRGVAAGSVATYASTQSPAGVTTSTTAEFAMTQVGPGSATYQVAANDLVFINKPTSQAGLGIGNVRVSGNNSIAVSFSNFTSATITPTASEKYGIVGIRGFSMITVVLTPAVVLANSTNEQLFTVTGIRAGELVQVMKPTLQAGIDIMGVRAAGNNQVAITFGNVSSVSVTPTAGQTYTVFSLGGIDSANNDVLVCANVGTVAAVGGTTATSATSSITVTGLASPGDTVRGVSKPAHQAGLGIVGFGVTAANTLYLSWLNSSGSGITPTASESYGVTLFRPNPNAPLVMYAPTLSPASVAPNTTAEQTFTVNGLLSGTPVWVNKPSWQSGLGIVGCRISASNTLAINFGNASGVTTTPTAGETYTVGNFQQAIPDGGSAWVYTASTVDQAQSLLANAVRSAMVSMGLIAGA